MRSDCGTLNVRAFGFAAAAVAASISAICAAALFLAPDATRSLLGYLIHADVADLAPAVSWASFFTGVVGWGLFAGIAFSSAAVLYNRAVVASVAREPAAAPGFGSRA